MKNLEEWLDLYKTDSLFELIHVAIATAAAPLPLLEMMSFALKMMSFAFEMMNFVLTIDDFAFKMMNFAFEMIPL